MVKKYALDTNILIKDPYALTKFEDNDVYIPLTVLEELDKQKSSDRDIAADARVAIRQLSSVLLGQGSKPLKEGCELSTGGRVFVLQDSDEEFIKVTCNDDKIINSVLSLQRDSDCEVILVTNDVCMSLKAMGVGIENVQEYQSDIVVEDPDLLPKGYVQIPDNWLNSLPTDRVIQKSCGETHIGAEIIQDLADEVEQDIGINDWLLNEGDKVAARLEGWTEDEDFAVFTFVNVDNQLLTRKASGIVPKDLLQAVAIDALLDPEIDIVVLDGAAGSGKTLLTMASGTEMVKGKKKSYRTDNIIFTRSNDTQFKEIGFLKGGETEKMAPWLAACTDNMEVIARATGKKDLHPSKAIKLAEDAEDWFIEFKNLGFMRGRSINHKFLVIDEAQNLTASQMKTILSRAGEYCKVVVLGNLGQIDNPMVSPRTSGLTYATGKLHGQPFAKVICLGGVYRSRLAEFVEDNF